jgi:Fe-S cluster assembly protein SufD
LSILSHDANAVLGGPEWLMARRGDARDLFASLGMPTAREEVWRYSPIDDLDLDHYEVGRAELPVNLAVPAAIEGAGAVVVHVIGGIPQVDELETPKGLQIQRAAAQADGQHALGELSGDALVVLNDAHLVDALVIDVDRAAMIDSPVIVLHHVRDEAVFPRTVVRLSAGSSATVLEVFVGGNHRTLSVPVSRLHLSDQANLRYGSLQLLSREAWHLATVDASLGQDASVEQVTGGLGAAYDRLRTDVALEGRGASSVLRSTYLGTGEQIHDLRTLQDHMSPRTQSDLLCKGAVSGTSRSIYSGVIKVQRGAVRSEAMQSNHNLVLTESAHADSVPNLDIEENDVRCSHASTVGPLDEDQRYYLESRGIAPLDAQRLLVRGFFKDLLERTSLPVAAELIGAELNERLDAEVGP